MTELVEPPQTARSIGGGKKKKKSKIGSRKSALKKSSGTKKRRSKKNSIKTAKPKTAGERRPTIRGKASSSTKAKAAVAIEPVQVELEIDVPADHALSRFRKPKLGASKGSSSILAQNAAPSASSDAVSVGKRSSILSPSSRSNNSSKPANIAKTPKAAARTPTTSAIKPKTLDLVTEPSHESINASPSRHLPAERCKHTKTTASADSMPRSASSPTSTPKLSELSAGSDASVKIMRKESLESSISVASPRANGDNTSVSDTSDIVHPNLDRGNIGAGTKSVVDETKISTRDAIQITASVVASAVESVGGTHSSEESAACSARYWDTSAAGQMVIDHSMNVAEATASEEASSRDERATIDDADTTFTLATHDATNTNSKTAQATKDAIRRKPLPTLTEEEAAKNVVAFNFYSKASFDLLSLHTTPRPVSRDHSYTRECAKIESDAAVVPAPAPTQSATEERGDLQKRVEDRGMPHFCIPINLNQEIDSNVSQLEPEEGELQQYYAQATSKGEMGNDDRQANDQIVSAPGSQANSGASGVSSVDPPPTSISSSAHQPSEPETTPSPKHSDAQQTRDEAKGGSGLGIIRTKTSDGGSQNISKSTSVALSAENMWESPPQTARGKSSNPNSPSFHSSLAPVKEQNQDFEVPNESARPVTSLSGKDNLLTTLPDLQLPTNSAKPENMSDTEIRHRNTEASDVAVITIPSVVLSKPRKLKRPGSAVLSSRGPRTPKDNSPNTARHRSPTGLGSRSPTSRKYSSRSSLSSNFSTPRSRPQSSRSSASRPSSAHHAGGHSSKTSPRNGFENLKRADERCRSAGVRRNVEHNRRILVPALVGNAFMGTIRICLSCSMDPCECPINSIDNLNQPSIANSMGRYAESSNNKSKRRPASAQQAARTKHDRNQRSLSLLCLSLFSSAMSVSN